MKIRSLSLLALVACFNVQTITLEEAITAAYNNSPAWLGEKTKKDIADEQLTQAKLLFLPSVSGKVTSGRNRNEVDQTQVDRLGEAHTRGTSKSTQTTMGVNVRQNLFSGFSTINTISARSAAAKAAHHETKFKEQELISKVLEAYASIWANRKIVVAMKNKEENLKKVLDGLIGMLEAGVKTQADVAAANANHQEAVYHRISAETELFAAESEFEMLTGLRADQNMELPDIKVAIPENLDKLTALALSANHRIQHSKLQEQAEASELDAVKGRLSPSCDLNLDASRSLEKDKYNNSRNHYSASVEVTVPIFENHQNQGNTYSAIAIANQKALQAKFAAKNTLLEITKDCVVNWNKYLAANAMIEASRSAVKSGEITSESNFEEAAIGSKSNTEILDDENKLLNARVNLAKSQKEKIVASAKILELCGQLDLRSLLNKG